VKFNGDDSKTTWEHGSQYLVQLGEASAIEEIRVHLFSLSLTRNAFSWLASLPVNSIRTWEQLEQKFHDHFCDNPPRKIPYYHLNQSTLVIKQ
jgi:hypothetical protein